MELAVGLWSKLPFEILERVLSFLPAPDLCRYRSVCKKWKSLIRKPTFVAACMRNVKDSDGSFIVARYYRHKRPDVVSSEPSDFERGVSIFDFKAKRWFTVLKDDERRTYSEDLVVDGGLVCQYKWQPRVWGNMVWPLIVYNPLENTTKTIEGTILHYYFGYDIPNMALVVDSLTRKYKIFLMRGPQCIFAHPMDPREPYMIVFDSATREWALSLNQPPDLPQESPDRFTRMCLCVVAHQNKLYTLAMFDVYEHQICCYNISQDVWEDLGIRFHLRDKLFFPQLIVSGDRLFLVTWSLEVENWTPERDWQLEVYEIMIPERTHVRIFGMTNAAVLQIFGRKSAEKIHKYKHPEVNAFIFGNSVVLMAKRTGILIMFDMVTRLLDSLPPNPSRPPADEGYSCEAKQTNLVLPTRRRS